MYLVKTKAGHFIPAYEADWEESKKIKDGDEVKATRARNPKFHRKFFALLKLGFSSQDKTDNMEAYRMMMVIKAGHVVFVQDKNGKPYALPKSLAFDKMGASEFEEVYNAVLTVICKEVGLTSEEIQNNLISFM